jgi:8-oxo-dGTP pyrophosphatase MutT (NUDIX family)
MPFKTETSAGGIVYKKEDNRVLWLVLQPAKSKWWGFPKGRIGDKVHDESMQEAALREVEEEGGIKTNIIVEKPISVQYFFKFQGYLVKKTVHYFLMEYVSGDIAAHDWEVGDSKWVTQEEAEKLISHKSDKEAFEKTLTQYEKISH